MTRQEHKPPLNSLEDTSKGRLGIIDTLKWWIQPPTFLLSIVIIAEVYIVIAYHVTDIMLLITLLIIPAVFAGIRVKDIVTMIATLKGFSHLEGGEQGKDTPP